MIKLPKKIVIYPQKKINPDYLLCWIPPESFTEVSIDSQVEAELTQFYPNGIEVELSEDDLDEFGIQLQLSPEKLRQAYLELHEQDALPQSGMIEVEVLGEYIVKREAGRSIEELTSPAELDSVSFSIPEDDLLSKMQAGPEMTGEEDSQDLFRRLSVRQTKLPGDQSGGE